ncbi:MAG: DUF421 domain-containing protein [Acidobacteria bacterium]|nr:DUF421 domain-containing protein [Acidobacteriota bacterium]MBI3281537.1 DUF421 domain-containing protein [Acidobacteriota bacterium]
MDAVVRGLVVYFFLLLVFRLSGNRTLSQATAFDLILLLIISETVQQAMVGTDNSITQGLLLVLTLVTTDILLSVLKEHSQVLDRWIDGAPLVVIDNGKLLHDRMAKLRVDEGDILAAARSLQGLERLDQIKYAVVERSGEITIVPRK